MTAPWRQDDHWVNPDGSHPQPVHLSRERDAGLLQAVEGGEGGHEGPEDGAVVGIGEQRSSLGE